MANDQTLMYERTALAEISVRPVLMKRLLSSINRMNDLLKLGEPITNLLAPNYNDPTNARLIRLRYKFTDVMKLEVMKVVGSGKTSVVQSQLTFRDGSTETMITVWSNIRLKSGTRAYLLEAGPLFETVSTSINK